MLYPPPPVLFLRWILDVGPDFESNNFFNSTVQVIVC
jgi:hypothetical protein